MYMSIILTVSPCKRVFPGCHVYVGCVHKTGILMRDSEEKNFTFACFSTRVICVCLDEIIIIIGPLSGATFSFSHPSPLREFLITYG